MASYHNTIAAKEEIRKPHNERPPGPGDHWGWYMSPRPLAAPLRLCLLRAEKKRENGGIGEKRGGENRGNFTRHKKTIWNMAIKEPCPTAEFPCNNSKKWLYLFKHKNNKLLFRCESYEPWTKCGVCPREGVTQKIRSDKLVGLYLLAARDAK